MEKRRALNPNSELLLINLVGVNGWQGVINNLTGR